jgi:uncharacterized protein YkwD
VVFLLLSLTGLGTILDSRGSLIKPMRSIFLPLILLILIPSFGFVPGRFKLANIQENSLDKELILELVNNARKKGCQCGESYFYQAPPLKWNEKLEKASFLHSKDMKENKYFSHTSPDGSKVTARLDRIGYRWAAYGENLAQGQGSEAEVVQGWLKSPGHCRNIMNKSYKEMGVGRFGDYWTLTFGTSK